VNGPKKLRKKKVRWDWGKGGMNSGRVAFRKWAESNNFSRCGQFAALVQLFPGGSGEKSFMEGRGDGMGSATGKSGGNRRSMDQLVRFWKEENEGREVVAFALSRGERYTAPAEVVEKETRGAT